MTAFVRRRNRSEDNPDTLPLFRMAEVVVNYDEDRRQIPLIYHPGQSRPE
ncbi:hypothetical protein D1BOALGB6SA_9773 [Olavius sp. associated proteobacterium Delta 1]|nr:hypothetical protein D1BOALGB6SA_9773 [Olavius sp. associated proteobacterium Delta 1]